MNTPPESGARRRPDWTLYLVTDPDMGARPVEAIVRAAVAGGVTAVQLRDKQATARALVAQAGRLREILAPRGIALIVNDRLDVALAAGADGVHLGQDDLACADARRIAGPDFLIGISVSSPAEARRAAADGADVLGVSPVFDTPTKRDTPKAAGLEGLRAIRRAVRLPLVGIGGLHAGNAAEVRRAGADGIAVVSAIMTAPDPEAAARELRSAIAAG